MLHMFGKLKDKIVQLVEDRVELLKLSVIESASRGMSYFIFIIICIFITSTILLLLGVALGEHFADVTDSRALGFLIAAGIYLALFLFMLLFRKTIFKGFADIFIRTLTEEDDDDDKDDTNNPAR